MNTFKEPGNSERRSGSERREFSYAVHIPERRSGIERRNRFDERDVSPLNQYYLENNNTYY